MSADLARIWQGHEHLRTKRAHRQLELGHDEKAYRKALDAGLLQAVHDCCERLGWKAVAYDLGISESQLRASVAGRERHHFRAVWLVRLLQLAADLDLARAVCTPAGIIVQPDPGVTNEQALLGLMRALMDRFSPDIIRPLLDDAHKHALVEAAKGSR